MYCKLRIFFLKQGVVCIKSVQGIGYSQLPGEGGGVGGEVRALMNKGFNRSEGEPS